MIHGWFRSASSCSPFSIYFEHVIQLRHSYCAASITLCHTILITPHFTSLAYPTLPNYIAWYHTLSHHTKSHPIKPHPPHHTTPHFTTLNYTTPHHTTHSSPSTRSSPSTPDTSNDPTQPLSRFRSCPPCVAMIQQPIFDMLRCIFGRYEHTVLRYQSFTIVIELLFYCWNFYHEYFHILYDSSIILLNKRKENRIRHDTINHNRAE